MNAKDFLEEIDYYNTNVDGEIFEDLGIETLADILEVYHQRKLKLLGIGVVRGSFSDTKDYDKLFKDLYKEGKREGSVYPSISNPEAVYHNGEWLNCL